FFKLCFKENEHFEPIKQIHELFRLEDYWEKLNNYREEQHINPIMKVVSMIPKLDLAAMAESLVNITYFKRKVGMGMETVAGPIDVAVISKGDGFIWVKRKRYFDDNLNPHYIAKVQKEVPDEANRNKK
ncbi:MAG: hypothetical protein ABIL68_00545, partial [bacterium]